MQSPLKPISLYIHWPYCLSKCPYCDFASFVCKAIDEDMLLKGYKRDMDLFLTHRPIDTIFFGGGTPSLMTPDFLEKFFQEITKRVPILPNAEISMEANPEAISIDKMRAFRDLGINRLSLGVQALNDKDLKFLGRPHSVQTALARIEEAQSVFQNINIDLIYARPGQSLKSWEKELKTALSLGLKHYSLYQLTIEENTVFGKQCLKTVSEKQAVALYKMTDDIMKSAKIPAYEVSNYACQGFECRHNMVYWLGKDYVGIGPAAHGRIGFKATQNPRSVGAWLKNGSEVITLTPDEKEEEKLLMGLRLRNHCYSEDNLSQNAVLKAISLGWVEKSEKGIRPTLKGTLVLDRLVLLLSEEN